MEGPQRYQHGGYQPINNQENGVIEDEFDLECLRDVNKYFIRTCPVPADKAKDYRFLTLLNICICVFCCGCCAIPFLWISYKGSEQVKAPGVASGLLVGGQTDGLI